MRSKKLLPFLCVSIALAGCNGLGKMSKNFGKVTYEVTPNPLEMHGDSVAIGVKGNYPPKYFAKKVDATVTPYIKSATAEHNYKSVTNVGEKSTTNGNKINYKAGGSFSYNDKMAYTDDMKASDVMVKATGMKGKKSKELGAMKIADGTIITPLLVMHDEKTIVGKDNFQRITPANYDGTIYFLINQSNVNSSFGIKKIGLNNKPEMSKLDSVIKMVSKDTVGYLFKGINIMGYASPDGAERINTPLSTNRAENASKYLMGQFKKMKMKNGADKAFYTINNTSEDWDGFRAQMEMSGMGQKDMILRIVASNSDPEAREMEIKKMGQAYEEIAENVLPKLRRSAVTLTIDKVGRSDEQITALAGSAPDSLNNEEILYAATLTQDMATKLRIYQSAERIYPQDWRAANNTGMVMFMQGNVDGAMTQFQKADQLSANNGVVKNNMGAVYSKKGDRKMAAEMYSAAANAGPEVAANMGIIDIRNGNYSSAVSNYGSSNTYNAALAKLLSGDKDGAMSTIDASPDANTAAGLYLKAIISARKGDASGVISNLTASIGKDGAMKAMARDDREFIKWFNDASFKALVQ